MHSIVTTFRGAVIKVEVANFCAAMDTLIDQDASTVEHDGTTADARLNSDLLMTAAIVQFSPQPQILSPVTFGSEGRPTSGVSLSKDSTYFFFPFHDF